MAISKYGKLLGLLCLIGSTSLAQEPTSSYDPTDSSVVPSKRLPQHTEFMANNYAFPAKPRNQWELGIKVGAFSIAGDVRSVFPGFGAGLHVRKALGYVFSLRGELGMGISKGLNYTRSSGFKRNPAWIEAAQQNKIILNAWTVNDKQDMQWLLEKKFDLITTNEPELLLSLLKTP